MRCSTRRPSRARAGATGYSLAEVVVSLAVFIAILLGVLFIFHLNYRQARGRGDTAQRQAEVRRAQHDLVRLVESAGRGGLPHTLAISVASNAEPGSRIGGPGSPPIVAGTDVLVVRGVFSSPLYRVAPADGGPTTALLEVRDPSPQTGVRQDLSELAATVEAARAGRGTLLLVSQLDESIYAVAGSAFGDAVVSRRGGRVAAVTLAVDSAGVPAAMAGAGVAAALRGAALLGLLEEYRIYVRRAFAAPGDEASAPRPQLSMARFVPGTDEPWGGDAANLAIDLADDVGDLQVALGFDVDGDGSVTDAPADPGADEWLFDDPGDEVGEPRWGDADAKLTLVRITTVAGSAGPPDPAADTPLEDRSPGDRPQQGWRLRSVVDLGGG